MATPGSAFTVSVPPTGYPPWARDGAMVKETSNPAVYLLFGHARFHIGDASEFGALGVSWSQLVTVPDGALAPYARVPDVGTVLRDHTAAEVWYSVGSRLWWVPTPDCFPYLGLTWSRVHLVPQGSLDSLPRERSPSASPTPSSVVWPPNPPHRWARNDVPGISLSNGSRLVELRGWLIGVDDAVNTDDPDWRLQLEPDPRWLDQIGVDWHTFYKVGDILAMGKCVSDPDDYQARAAIPTIHLEVNGWDPAKHAGAQPPKDWTLTGATVHPGVGWNQLIWPYLPTTDRGATGATPLAAGQYVRVYGSVIADIPHAHGQGKAVSDWFQQAFGIGTSSADYGQAALAWIGSGTEQDETAPARWTEIHPPDLIEILPDQPRTEAVYGITVIARSATLSPVAAVKDLTVDLRPPGTRPAHTKCAVREFVGPETRFGSIIEGNANHSGAAITLFQDRATIHVKVQGDAFQGSSGRFKAVYRLSWVPDPNSYRLAVTVTPRSILAGTPTAVTFNCVDADTRTPVAGTVTEAGTRLGATNTPLTVTFHPAYRRVRTVDATVQPPLVVWELEPIPPTVTISATGYPDTVVAVPVVDPNPPPGP
jgi:hypothetical protein